MNNKSTALAMIKDSLKAEYYQIPTRSVKFFGITKAVFIAYLFDREFYSSNDDKLFKIELSKIEEDLKLDKETIQECFEFFKSIGVIEYMPVVEYCHIDKDKLADYCIQNGYYN